MITVGIEETKWAGKVGGIGLRVGYLWNFEGGTASGAAVGVGGLRGVQGQGAI